MSPCALTSVVRPTVAFGPEMPGWGSWDYLGQDLIRELAPHYRAVSFQGEDVPECDVVILVKHALSPQTVDRLSRRCRIVYLPGVLVTVSVTTCPS